jgi:HK97 family phage major capsid protein
MRVKPLNLMTTSKPWSKWKTRSCAKSRYSARAWHRRRGRSEHAIAVAPNGEKKGFKTLGEQLVAVATAARTDSRNVDPRLIQAAASGASEAVPSDGGFLVQKDFSSEILKRTYSLGEILTRVNRKPVSGNGLKINGIDETSRVDGSRYGGVQAFWANEADTVTAKKPKFRQIDLNLNKLFAIYYATDELCRMRRRLVNSRLKPSRKN